MKIDTTFRPEQWVDHYADSLYQFILSRVSEKQLAEDIVQETFLSAWKSREQYNGSSSEKNWIFAICKNKIIDHYRKSLKHISYQEIPGEDFYFDSADHWTIKDQPSSWPADHHKTIDNNEFHTVLDHCRSKLREMQQKVFSLKYIDDLKAEEVCRILEISLANYWVLMHRAKLQLRACIEKNWMNL